MSEEFPRLGPELLADGLTRFRLWAPAAEKSVELVWTPPGRDGELVTGLARGAGDVWEVTVPGAPAGTAYAFRLDGDPARTWPDPLEYAELRPGDVDGPSLVVDLAALVKAPGRPPGPVLTPYLLAAGGVMELHTASETAGGTFADLAERLDEVAALGLAGVELMPVAVAAGAFDWGYNGIDPGSVASGLGGWAGLVELVDAAHRRGLAIGVDLVGNHVGPDGGYIHAYGPFSAGAGPWGDLPDYESPAVRAWWLQSVERMASTGVDFLRLDAVQGMYGERRPVRPHVLIETAARLRTSGQAPLLVAEAGSDWVAANQGWLLAPVEEGGAGVAGFWDDDLRHALFLWAYDVPLAGAELTRLGLAGYLPRVAALVRGDGDPSATTPVTAAEVAATLAAPAVGAAAMAGHGHWRAWRNHDQTGNHLLGFDSGLQGLLLELSRLGLTPRQAQTVAEAVAAGRAPEPVPDVDLDAAVARAEAMDRAMFAFIWSQPGTPYDFQRARFPYAHGSTKPEIVRGTVDGRAREFGFGSPPTAGDGDPDDLDMPLPHDPATFVLAARGPRDAGPERALLQADLVAARRGLDLDAAPVAVAVGGGDGVLSASGQGAARRVVVVNRGRASIEVDLAEHLPGAEGPWLVALDTGVAAYGGDGQSPASAEGSTVVVPPATLVHLTVAQD